jgi:hypothetical protein
MGRAALPRLLTVMGWWALFLAELSAAITPCRATEMILCLLQAEATLAQREKR